MVMQAVDIQKIQEQAEKELKDEIFRKAVDAEKARLLNKEPWFDLSYNEWIYFGMSLVLMATGVLIGIGLAS